MSWFPSIITSSIPSVITENIPPIPRILPNYSSLTPYDTASIYYQTAEEMKCDCLYFAVKLGIAHLHYIKYFEEYVKIAKNLIDRDQPIPIFRGIKISLGNNDDSQISIKQADIYQTIRRTLVGESRQDLKLIRPHLIKLLCCFNYKHPYFNTIIRMCKLGIEDLLKGYKCSFSQVISISQKIENKQENPQLEPEKQEIENKQENLEISQNIKIQPDENKTDFAIRCLEDDIALLEEAMKKKDEKQEAEFAQKLEKERGKYFRLDKLILDKNTQKTVHGYITEILKNRWDDKTLSGVANFFEAAENKYEFNYIQSLENLIVKNPDIHQALKIELRELVNKSLLTCEMKTEYSFIYEEINN